MNASSPQKLPAISLVFNRVLILLAISWTVLVCGMLAWHLSDTSSHVERIAHETAFENIQKDILYRAWAAEHGGVYVPVTAKTPPNPYLRNIKERDIITPSGRMLTLINPAYMTRQVHELGRRRNEIKGHITSSRPIRPENRPDAWEQKALDIIAGEEEQFGEIVMLDGEEHYRLMFPLFISEPCLKCHAAQGYKPGDLRGGISAAVPMRLFDGVSRTHAISEFRHFAAVWLAGIAGMLLVRPYMRRRIAERDSAEQMLRESEEYLRLAVESGGVGLWEWDVATGKLDWNDRLKAVFGLPPDAADLTLEKFIAAIHPDDAADTERRFRAALREQREFRHEYRLVRPDKSMRWIEAIGKGVYGEKGKPLRMRGSVQDITERKQAEEALRASEENYRNLFMDNPMPMWVYDAGSLAFLAVNDFAVAQYQFSRDEFLKMTIRDIRPPEGLPHLYDTLKKGEGKKLRSNIVAKHRRKDGSLIDVEIMAHEIRYEGRPAMLVLAQDVTERKRTEDALQTARGYTENLIRTANTMLVGLDAHGRVTVFNRAAENITGYTIAELQGRNWFELVVPRDRYPHVWKEFERLLSGGLPKNFENPILTKSGEERYIVWQNNEVHEHGRVTGTISFGMDITDRRKMERALKESEERFRVLFLDAPDAIFLADPDTGIIADANEAAERLMQRSRDELVGLHQARLHPPDEETTARAVFDRHTRKEASGPSEHSILQKDGTRVPVHIGAKIIVFGGKRFLMGVFRDIREIKRLEGVLKEHARMLEEAQRIAHFGSYAFSPATGQWECSRTLDEIFGITDPAFRKDVDGWLRIVHPADREDLGRYFAEHVLRDRNPFDREYRIVRLNDQEERWVYGRGELTSGPDGAVSAMIGTIQDVTAERKAVEDRQKLESQLLQAQKIESVGRLAGGVAHDINNMLMPILGYAELLNHRMPENDSRREDVDAIIRSTERVRDITRQLLAFARKQTMEMKLLDLNKVVEGFGKMLRRTLREDIAIKTEYASSPCMIRGDAGQIEQIILNLAINAQDAMAGGGALGIKTSPVFLDEAFADVRPGAVPGEYVSLSLSDNGMGMNEDVRNKIFEPFYTTKEIGRGTGLGLSTVYGIVKQHGGYIDVQSEAGRGSTFIVYFPAEEKQMAQMESDEAKKSAPGGTETLLVVEDQQDVLDVVTQMLRVGGYHVLRAADGKEAQSIAGAHQGPIDLLITDVIMPGMNGKELYESLARDRKGLRVLYMSGYPADVISTHGVLHTGTNFIRKPCSLRELMCKVREVLES